MPDAEHNRTDAELQQMLRAEIVALRDLLAQRDAEIAALLENLPSSAPQAHERHGAKLGLPGRFKASVRRLRQRMGLRRQTAALSGSPLFDAQWYARRYPECGGAEKAAVHYLVTGAFAGNDPGPDFDTKAYYRANPDVAEAKWPALAHFVLHGQAEGRPQRPETKG